MLKNKKNTLSSNNDNYYAILTPGGDIELKANDINIDLYKDRYATSGGNKKPQHCNFRFSAR